MSALDNIFGGTNTSTAPAPIKAKSPLDDIFGSPAAPAPATSSAAIVPPVIGPAAPAVKPVPFAGLIPGVIGKGGKNYPTFPSGYGGSMTKSDPFSGVPLLTHTDGTFKAGSNITLPDRVATTFDPTVPQKLTRDVLTNERLPLAASEAVRKIMGASYDEQLDHTISLQIAGSNLDTNLNPVKLNAKGLQPLLGLENQLGRMVVNGDISLLQAQRTLALSKGKVLPDAQDLPSPADITQHQKIIVPAAVKAVGGFFTNIAKGFYDQFAHPSATEQAVEKTIIPQGPITGNENVDKFIRAVGLPGTAAIQTFTRFFEPMVQPLGQNIGEGIGGYMLMNWAKQGKITQQSADDVIKDFSIVNKTAPQVVGDVAMAVLAIMTPEKVGDIIGTGGGEKALPGVAESIAKNADKGLMARIATGFIKGGTSALPLGAGFAGASVLQSGSKDPAVIFNIVAQNLAGAFLLGGVTGGTSEGIKGKVSVDEAITKVQTIRDQAQSSEVQNLLDRTLKYLNDEKSAQNVAAGENGPAPVDANIKASAGKGASTPEDAAARYEAEVINPNRATGEATVIGADSIKDLYKDYDPSTHSIYSKAALDLYQKEIALNPSKDVVLTAGGPGSAKTELLMKDIIPKTSGVVMESTLSNYDWAKARIAEAKALDKNVEIYGVLPDPETSRYFTLKRGVDTGREVPTDFFVKTHVGAVDTMIKLIEDGENVKVLDTRGIKTEEQLKEMIGKSDRYLQGKDALAALREAGYNEDNVRQRIQNVKYESNSGTGERHVSTSGGSRADQGGKANESAGSEPVLRSEGLGSKESKIAKSVEAKAIEEKLTEGFSKVAGYDPITIKEQAKRAADLITSDLELAREVIRGDKPLPEGLKGTALIAGMEEYIKAHPSADLAYELANSPLISETSAAAQELRLAAEREPDSATAKLLDIKKAREEKVKDLPEKRTATRKQIKAETEKVNLSKEELSWDKFLNDITC